jgi:hypothetical protein
MKLTVHEALKEDVYRDFARIPEIHRIDRSGKPIVEGEVRRITFGSKTALVIMRGWSDTREPGIRIDERTRNLLGVSVGQNIDVSFNSVCFGVLRWALHATDIAYRIMAQLAILSVVLGLVGVLLGLLGLKMVGSR